MNPATTGASWIPYVLVAVGLANLLGVIPLVRYALRSEIRDQILAHDQDPNAHQNSASVKRLRKWAHAQDNTMTSLVFSIHSGDRTVSIPTERLGIDD